VAAVAQIAHAYVACFEREPPERLPTAAAVRGLMRKAGAFESELSAEGSSRVPSEVERSFRGSVKSLRGAASTVERRSAGRPAFSARRIFVLHLARCMEMCGDFPGGSLPRSLLRMGRYGRPCGPENTEDYKRAPSSGTPRRTAGRLQKAKTPCTCC
jgi:hypothetical protein